MIHIRNQEKMLRIRNTFYKGSVSRDYNCINVVPPVPVSLDRFRSVELTDNINVSRELYGTHQDLPNYTFMSI